MLCRAVPELAAARQLALDFYLMFKRRDNSLLDTWLEQVNISTLPEFKEVAARMESDFSAVREAVSSSWSNGVVEGHVNRLKMLKRQMYGRAGFELLRRRVISPLA
jgi:transposase